MSSTLPSPRGSSSAVLDLRSVGLMLAGGALALGTHWALHRAADFLRGPVNVGGKRSVATHHRMSESEGGWASVSGSAKAHTLEDGEESGRGTRVFRVAITGGPCGGKSSSLSKLKEKLNALGWDLYACPETPTMLMNGGCRYPGIDGGWRLSEFEAALISLQLQVERAFTRIAASTGRPSIVVMDRGILDIKAYLPAEQWAEVLEAAGLDEEYLISRYDAVLHLVTAAEGAEAFYNHGHTSDDSGLAVYREETPAEARVLDKKVRDAWRKHPRHGIIHNLDDGFEGKLCRAEAFVTCLIDAA